MEKPVAMMKGKKSGKCLDCGDTYDKNGKCSCNRSSAGKKAAKKKAPAKKKSGNRYGGLVGSDLRDF